MSILLADIDATCAALGYNDGEQYRAEPDAIQGLKHLIWILRRDLDNHEYRRHLGRAKVLQTDLVPMLPHYIDDDEYSDVLIRLLVILTNPTLLLYRDGGIPKDNHGRKIYMELIDILQGYKEGFTSNAIWAALALKIHNALDEDWSLRSEEQGLIIERILVLVRNVLQVPANPEIECRADNDASLHDQVIWALHQSGLLDLILYILASSDENQYHLHALEIVCLLYREQTAPSLADASLQRSNEEKQHDEQELIAARRREKQKLIARPPPGRHSRFGGTYVLQNVKSISDRDIICHQSLERATDIDFDREKRKQKRSHRVVNEENASERRSAFSVRLCLRELCIEILKSAYNTLIRQVRRVLERNTGTGNHDDSYLLWSIRFFMEFNRLNGLQLDLVSESLSVQCFHWILTRIQHDLDMIISDKNQARLWARRLHVAVQTFRELLLSLLALQKLKDDKAYALFDMLINNVCYVLEYRETILHLLMNYNETYSTKAFLRDVIETSNIFIKMMEKFCKDSAVLQEKKRGGRRTHKKHNKKSMMKNADKNMLDNQENFEELENKWIELSNQVTELLSDVQMIKLSEEEQAMPFDATLEKSIDDQKEDCVIRINNYLREQKLEQAICLMRAAREVWPENDNFGGISSAPEDELIILREIYMANLGKAPKTNQEQEENNSDSDSEDIDSEEEGETGVIEKTFKFEDFTKRLVNLKVVRACTVVLSQWEKIPTKTLKAAVTILHRIAYGSHCPAMLYQAILFKIFQSVMDAPREQHHEELRRLAIYVIRKFVETAPSNPKIYAELLFYKTIREANELETGYCDNYEAGIKGAWSQEQEDELRILFEENQRNPETDKDVIDWILDNLIDKTRTRRGILKKLKEMGLMFKAPTKKSSVANKNLWQREEDEQLKELYDEHRLDEKCLSKIVEVMGEKRSQRAIVKRMIELHLIADKSEILPSKRGKKSQKHNSNSTDESDSDDWITSRDQLHQNLKKTKKKIVRKVLRNPLDLETLKDNISELNEDFISVINWLIESLQEASEDIEQEIDNENNSDSDVPLFPITTLQIRAVEDENFRKILEALGLKSPQEEISTYWRIPSNFKATDLKLRIKALKDESIDENDIVYDEVVEYQTDEEATVKARKQKKLSKKKNQPKLLDKLLKKSKKQETRKVKKNPLDIETVRTLISQIDDKYKEAMEWLAESIFDAADDTEEANNEEDGIPLLPMLENQKDAMENDDFKKLLIALGIQPPIQEIETYWRIPIYLKTEDLKKRAQILRGQEIEGEDDVIEELHEESNENDLSEHNESSSNESGSSKDGDDFFDTYVKNRREKMQSLVYNDSDNDDGEIRKPLKKKPQRKLKAEKKENKKDLETKPKKNEKKIKKKGALNLDDMVLLNFENPLDSNPDLDFDSENLRLRLAELSDEEDEENKMNENFPNTTVRTKKKINLIESDDDDDDNEKTIGNTSLNNFNMNSQTTNNIETNSASIQHHRRHRRNIIDSDSDEESNNITETNENLNYNSITNTTTNDYGHSKENIEKENLSNLYEIDSMKDITGKLNQDEDDLMDEIEANNQSSIYNKTTKITTTTTTTTVNDEDDDNNDETIVGTSSATTNFINNIKSSETNFVLKLDDNGDSISMISNDITSITKTSTLLSSSTKSTQLNIKHGQISDIDNDSDKNIIINADETNDVDGNSDGVIDTINKEKRKLKNNLSSDDDDDEDIIVKRRKIVNTNDDINVIDDEKDDNNRKIPEHKYRRIANIIDDADDDDE